MTFAYPHMELGLKTREKCTKAVGNIHNFFQQTEYMMHVVFMSQS